MFDWISVSIAVITLVVTIFIPIQVMKFQRYTSLMSTYMTLDFAHAYQSVINFFYEDCECNVERIAENYRNRYISDFSQLKKSKIEKENILHYQRRLLNDYFLELEICRESSWVLKQRIRKDWTTSEAWVVKILIYMNKAIDSDEENLLFKDISCIKHDKMPKTKGMSKYLENFYNALKLESRNMQL